MVLLRVVNRTSYDIDWVGKIKRGGGEREISLSTFPLPCLFRFRYASSMRTHLERSFIKEGRMEGILWLPAMSSFYKGSLMTVYTWVVVGKEGWLMD